MEQPLDPRDGLTERLAAFGRQPVDPALQSAHLTAMAGVPTGSALRSALASRLKLAAAVVFGFLLGTTGLASAGALGPLQPIAATVVEKATPLDVPKGPKEAKAAKANGGAKRYYGPECVVVDGKPARNRGQYLKQQRQVSHEAFQAAKQTDCGKPESSREGGNKDGADGEAEKDDATTEDADEPRAGKSGDKGRADCVENGPTTTGKPECTPTTGQEDRPEPKKPADAGDDDAQDPDAEDDGVSGQSDRGSERRPEKAPAGPGGKGNGGNGRPAPPLPTPPTGESTQEFAPVS